MLEEKESRGITDTALVRIEQLYPLPLKQLQDILAKYDQASEYFWTQEEPVNMGAWGFFNQHFNDVNFRVIARPASGSPATGSSDFHKKRQRKIIEKTFGECECPRIETECRMVCIGNRWQSVIKELNVKL